MAFPVGQAGAAQHRSLVHQYIVAYLSRFAYDYSGAVIDEKAAADVGAGVYLDACNTAVPLRKHAGRQFQMVLPQEMGDAVPP
jgi:hypothetical protein